MGLDGYYSLRNLFSKWFKMGDRACKDATHGMCMRLRTDTLQTIRQPCFTAKIPLDRILGSVYDSGADKDLAQSLYSGP
jgi:hypothetical protein